MLPRELTLALALLAGFAHLAAAETYKPAGTWTGVILLQPAEFEIDTKIVFRQTENGGFTGTVSYPAMQGDREFKLDSVRLEGKSLEFSSKDEQGTVSSFRATFADGGDQLEGELTEGGQQAPFTLTRAPETLPAGAVPTLLELDGQASALKAQFNQETDKVRLLMILSPTCSLCRMGARLVQRYVTDVIADPRLRIYLVWEAVNPSDTLEQAQKASWVLSDSRVQSFWSPGKGAGLAFQNAVGMKKSTAWDVFLVFDQDKTWGEAVPQYDVFMHNQREGSELPREKLLNAKRLAGDIESLLKNVKAAPKPSR